jgi:hypothetical protein
VPNNRCQPGLLLHQDYDNRKTLSPGRLDRILDEECGARPTVVVVSACHSGVFIGRASKGDNRIWPTAARDEALPAHAAVTYGEAIFSPSPVCRRS